MRRQFSLSRSQNRHRPLHSTHSRHSHLFYAIMSRREISLEKLLKRAEVNDYKRDVHQTKNSIKNNIKYVKKTLKNQN